MEPYQNLKTYRTILKFVVTKFKFQTAKEIKKGNYYHFALPIEGKIQDNLSETLNNIKLSIYSLHELSQK